MPAVIRDVAKARRGQGGSRPKPRATYSPAKLGGAASVGVDPRAAIWAAGGVVGLACLVALATGGRAKALGGDIGGFFDRQAGHAGFHIAHVSVQGASSFSTSDVMKAASLYQGQPILGLDLAALQGRVEQVGWIRSAKVVRLLPDTLVIAVKERPRLAVWQHEGATELVDQDGHVIPEADAGLFPDLPLIVGEGANEAAAAILPLIQARPRLMAKLDAVQRIDGRRWRLRLKDGSDIDLPATHEDGALLQFDQLEGRSHLLDVGFERIDLRDPNMITVRPKGATPPSGATT